MTVAAEGLGREEDETGRAIISAEGLDRLQIFPHRVVFVAEEPVVLPPSRLPNILRGSFEIAFRRLVCHDVSLDCHQCPLLEHCAYPAVFRPSPPAGTDRLSRAQDLPRPFVFEPPWDGPERLEPGGRLEIGLTLLGKAAKLLPYFVVALREMGRVGLGPTRGRLRLEAVTLIALSGEQTVFTADRSVLIQPERGIRVLDLTRAGDGSATAVRIAFRTPTTLKREGLLVERPTFADVVKRARDRLSSLAAFFGDGPLEIDFAAVGEAACSASTKSCTTAWERRTRRSSRTGHVHETSGIVGEAVYEGELGMWMPLLRLAEAVHVGKYAVWGNGWIGVEVVR